MLQAKTVQLLGRDWLNEFTTEKRRCGIFRGPSGCSNTKALPQAQMQCFGFSGTGARCGSGTRLALAFLLWAKSASSSRVPTAEQQLGVLGMPDWRGQKF